MLMNSTAPQIGFDRFIRKEWATAALKVRARQYSLDDFMTLLDSAGLGVEAKKKTRTVLNRLWLEPRPDLVEFAERGCELFRTYDEKAIPVLHWGMAISSYPFFGKVAELVGRLSSLQGDCTSKEVHRRMSEIYGEREGTRRMSNMVIQTQADWGVLQRIGNGNRLVKQAPTTLQNEALIVWIVEAAIRYKGDVVSLKSLPSLPVLFPYELDCPLAYVVSNSKNLELRSDGSQSEFVAIRE
jgi:hypothetical protein